MTEYRGTLYRVRVFYRGDEGGVPPYKEEITVRVPSGDPGSSHREFVEFLERVFREWYAGAEVSARRVSTGWRGGVGSS